MNIPMLSVSQAFSIQALNPFTQIRPFPSDHGLLVDKVHKGCYFHNMQQKGGNAA
jgi:hypothetical protein